MILVIILLIVTLIVWVGYQTGRSDVDGTATADSAKAYSGHPLYKSPEERRETYARDRNLRLACISADTSDWLNGYAEECESPAEEAFLRAIAAAYSLLPQNGILNGGGLTLQMQVDEGPYRIDFLLNGWLVVEIDGDEHHTSPEQVRRDGARDKLLKARDLTVLRIAARTVFRNPSQAVSDVQAALARGRKAVSRPASEKPDPEPMRPRPANIFSAFSRGLEAVADGASRINEFADRTRTLQAAMGPNRQIFAEEKTSIKAAIEIADNRLSLEKYYDEHPGSRDELTGIIAELSAVTADTQPQAIKPIGEISLPERHLDPDIDQAIQRSHEALLVERAAYFESVRDEMRRSDGRRSTLIRAALMELGRHPTWTELAGGPGQFVRLRPSPLLRIMDQGSENDAPM